MTFGTLTGRSSSKTPQQSNTPKRPSLTMPKKEKIYIAGPMTGLPNFNFDRFHAAAAMLKAYGFDVVNPATLDNGSTNKPWEYYMRIALKAMLDCDKVYALAGSQNSRGAMIEIELARKLSIPIQHEYTGSSNDFF